MTTWRPLTSAALLCSGLIGCRSSANSASDGEGGEFPCGTSACEAVTWPRLVVAIAGTDLDAGPTEASVSALINGSVAQPMTGGCPGGYDVIDCQYSFYGYPGLEEITLQASTAAGSSSRSIALMPFNYCGNDLAYVHLILNAGDGRAPTIGAPQYVSPCQMQP
jgi:hypothetical protein